MVDYQSIKGGTEMNYVVQDHTKRGKVFATLDEANAYRNECIQKTGYVYCITETNRKVTHIYKIEEEN